jgi:hypothetical protein
MESAIEEADAAPAASAAPPTTSSETATSAEATTSVAPSDPVTSAAATRSSDAGEVAASAPDPATLVAAFGHYTDASTSDGGASTGGGGGGATPDHDDHHDDDLKAPLSSRFVVKPDDFVGPTAGNWVTQDELAKVEQVYDAIQNNRGDLRLQLGDGKLRAAALEDVARLLETGSGRDLVYKLSNNVSKEKDRSGNLVHRTTYVGESETEGGEVVGVDEDLDARPFNGSGADAQANYHPGSSRAAPAGSQDPAWPMRSDVTLYHELTHAYHKTLGSTATGTISSSEAATDGDAQRRTKRYEYQAVGLGDFAQGPQLTPTENSYRRERAIIGAENPDGTGVVAGDRDMSRRYSYKPT